MSYICCIFTARSLERPISSLMRGRYIYDLSIRNTVVLDWTNSYIQSSPEKTPPKALMRELRVVLERLPEPTIQGRRKLMFK
jgi:hypothetical protein